MGTEVSAKYRGAFCEATIKHVKKLIKIRVSDIDDAGGAVLKSIPGFKLPKYTALLQYIPPAFNFKILGIKNVYCK